MSTKAWIKWVGKNQQPAADEVINLLIKTGIDVQDYNVDIRCMPGVVFSNANEGYSETCEQLQELSQNGKIPVLVCCGATIVGDAAWRLMKSGASDVLVCQDCKLAVSDIAARLQRWEWVEQMVNSPDVQNALVGESHALKAVLRQVVEVAHFTDASVLIMGESGTGKELIANLIHQLDVRDDKGELVIIDCSTITPELSGSEFFGHERGAFTGAISARDGGFALADGGTLFLDEVGELPLHLQAQLLRVIQERTFKRVGGNAWQRTAFRLVCATNRDLWAQVQRGEFRADLYYRIASFVCHLPALRERPEDILSLTHHFLQTSNPGRKPPALDTCVQEYLLRREYPGNVRDLKQVVARLLCRHAGQSTITVGCIPPNDRPTWVAELGNWRDAEFERSIRVALARGVGLKSISRETEETAIRIAVDEASGNLQCAALRLGVTDRALQIRRAAQRQKN